MGYLKDMDHMTMTSIQRALMLLSIISAAFIMIISLPSTEVYAEGDSASGVYTEESVSYTWELNTETQEVTITDVDSQDEYFEMNIPAEIEGHTVTDITWNCMYYKNMTSISFPDGIIDISDRIMCMPALETVFVSDNNPGLCVHDGVLFSKDLTHLYIYPSCRKGDVYNVPDTVCGISTDAFSGTKYLEEVTLPDRITSLGRVFSCCDSIRVLNLNMVSFMGGTEIYGCGNIEKVTVSEDNPGMFEYDNVLYSKNPIFGSGTTLMYYPAGRADATFTIPQEVGGMKVTAVMDRAFAFTQLTEITMPGEVEWVGGWAFQGSTQLTTVILSDITRHLGSNLFYMCNSMKYVYVPESVSNLGYSTNGGPSGMEIYIKSDVLSTEDYDKAETSGRECFTHLKRSDYEQAENDGCSFHNFDKDKIPQPIKLSSDKTISKIVTLDDGSSQFETDDTCGDLDFSASARKGVVYTIDDTSVATVDDNGIVCPLKAGTVQLRITAVVADGDEEYFAPTDLVINIRIKDTSKPESAKQTITGKSSFTKTFGSKAFSLGQKAETDLTYKSSNSNVAKVDRSGKVTLVRPGKAKIIVTASADNNYQQAVKTINVSAEVGIPTFKVKAGTRKAKLNWSKVPHANGYQIYIKYPGKSKFKKALTTSGKVKGVAHKSLTKGKYYSYKIRSFVIIDGKKYYGKFSKVSKIKIK